MDKIHLKRNAPVAQLYEDAIKNEGAAISSTGALINFSGKKTGRSPKDKRIVYEETSKDDIWVSFQGGSGKIGQGNAAWRILDGIGLPKMARWFLKRLTLDRIIFGERTKLLKLLNIGRVHVLPT